MYCLAMLLRGYSDKVCILRSCPRLQRPNFQTVQTFLQFVWSVEKYINLPLGGTSQQFGAFKFVKIFVFCTHPSFSRFHTEYSFDQISRLFKGLNAGM